MSEGVTTVGSIVGKLSVDSSEWTAELDRAEARARELGAANPTLQVSAETAGAVSRLEEVQAVEERLGASSPTVHVSAETAGATANLAAVTAAENRLDAAQHDVADSALEQAAAERVSAAATSEDTAATGQNVNANKSRITGMTVLLTLLPAIAAAAVPVATSAVGLGSAFGVMAVSGVLAFKGIQNEMAAGTVEGQKYAAGVATLKTSLDTLEHTSAVAMLGSFNQAGQTLESYMPNLNAMFGQFSGVLGQIGVTTLHGVLSGLIQMNPLIQAGGVELGKFVTWLFSFTESNGFSEFIAYGIANLPPVMGMIENLVTLAGHILAAFAPLGPAVIGFISGLSSALSGLPLPVLAGLVTSALLLGPAMQAAFAPTVAGLITKVAIAIGLTGTMADLAVPVVGILIAALAGIGVAAAAAAASQQTATVATQDYTSALKDDNDALGQHVRLQAAKALSDAGAFTAAQQLGISQKTLTDATLGNAYATKQVQDALDAANGAYTQSIASTHGMSYGMAESSDAAKAQRSAIDTVSGALGAQRGAIAAAQQSNKDMAAAMDSSTGAASAQAAQYGTTTAAYQAATSAQQATADQLAQTTVKMQLENDAAGLLKAALDGLNGKALSAAQAQNAFDSSLTNMGDHVDKTGKQITFTTTSITDMSSASVALRGQLNGQVSALEGVVEANGGLANSTGEAKAQMATMRQQIIDNAVAHGVDKDAVSAYIDKILAIPTDVPPTKLDIDKGAADSKLSGVTGQLKTLTGAPWNVNVTATDNATPVVAAAAQAIDASTNLPKTVTLDANTDSIKPKLTDLKKNLDEATAPPPPIPLSVKAEDAHARVDMLQAHIDGLQQKKEALLKVGTVDALQQASNLQAQIDDTKQKKAIELMVNPDPAIASTTSIQDHIDELKQKNQPQLKADPLPAWEMIAKTQDSIDVLHQKHDIPIMVDTAAASHAVANFQGEIDALHGRSIQITTTYVTNGVDTGIPNTTNVPNGGGNARFQATGGVVAYLASGGSPFPGAPRGTDTVPTWLTPGEFVVNRDATARNRGALEAMNAGGTLAGQAQAPNITVYVTNPWTGEQVQAVVHSVASTAANQAITAADRDSARRRVGV